MRITLYGFLNYDPTLFDDVVLPEDISKDDVINEIIRRSGDLFPYHQALPYLKTNITRWFNRNYTQFERMIGALMEEYSPIENYDRYQKDTTTPKEKVTEQHSGTDTNAHTGTITDAHTGTVTDSHTGTVTDAHTGTVTDAHTGTITDVHSGTDTDTNSGTDERTITSTPGVSDTTESQVSPYNATGYVPSEKTTISHTGYDQSVDSLVNGKSTETAYDSTLERTHLNDDTRTYLNDDTRTYLNDDTRTYLNDDSLTHGEKVETTNSGSRDFESHIHGNIGVTSNVALITQELELRRFDIYTDIARRFEKEFLIQVY